MTGRDSSQATDRRRVLILIGIGIALLVQGAYAARPQPQPYPAFVLPGFDETASGGVARNDRVMVDVNFADGSTERIYPKELFGDFNYASIPGTIEYVFDPAESNREQVPEDAVAWLRDRTRALYPGRPVVVVRFCWQKQRFDLDSLESSTSGCVRDQAVRL